MGWDRTGQDIDNAWRLKVFFLPGILIFIN